MTRRRTALAILAIALAGLRPAAAQVPADTTSTGATTDDAPAAPENWAVHGQSTFTEPYHPAFRSPYSGPRSLNGGSRGDETFDVTLYGGLRLWRGAEVWVNPEINQGFGLSDTFGVAGFPCAESHKLGSQDPNDLNAGGLGILIGDGQLPNSGAETIVETYYSVAVLKYGHIAADYQFINNPAYNRDRGPVSVLGPRLHARF